MRRVGYGSINQGTSTVDGESTRTLVTGVRPFSAAVRSDFYNRLYNQVINNFGTPLRRAANDVGNYFERSDAQGPWNDEPGALAGDDDAGACRQSFHILMTDGFWNGGSPGVGNADNSSGPTITNAAGDSYQYTATGPFRDGFSNTLGDVGMEYWKRDLRTDLDNEVPVNAQDPAFWQHLVTYGIGLGVTGDVDPATALAAVPTGTDIAWADPAVSNPAKIDDLLHFGLNSRGGFFSAADPDAFADALGDVLEDIVERVEESATSAATSAAVLQTDTLLFSASFRSEDWTGDLVALPIDAADGSVGSAVWSAETVLAGTAPGSRKLLTHTGSAGALLDYADLSSAQQSALDHDAQGNNDGLGADRIAWLRGNEISGLRSRSGTFGLPAPAGRHHQRHAPSSCRIAARAINCCAPPSRPGPTTCMCGARTLKPELLLVASNGGMLHAFDAEDGSELFAYVPGEVLEPVPGEVFAPLSQLTAPQYQHRYLVDGTPTVSDALVDTPSGKEWKTVAVGSMGVGGRSIFALDISDPENMTANEVLWEFSDDDLGYGVSDVQIVPMENDKFAAVFGNGYNSASNKAMLFVVDMSDGSLIAKINTEVGGTSNPNGLATPLVSDWPDNDLIGQFVYAGDLQGNLWRFDVSDPDPTKWDDNTLSLFSAVDPGGAAQPITAQPRVALNPERPGELMVLFGTGSFFRSEDRDAANPQIQTLYGVRDSGASVTTSRGDRDDLLQQEITFETTTTALGKLRIVREVSNNDYTAADEPGWYLDLAFGGAALGERVISRATFPSSSTRKRVRFTTLRPDADPCSGGRDGFLFDIDLADGSQFGQSVFDINSDGVFNVDDQVSNKIISAISSGFGEELTVIRNQEGTQDFLYTGEGERVGGSLIFTDPIGRQSWQQLR